MSTLGVADGWGLPCQGYSDMHYVVLNLLKNLLSFFLQIGSYLYSICNISVEINIRSCLRA